MNQSTSFANDSMGMQPVHWRTVAIWVDDSSNPTNFEAYTSPSCGVWYRLRRANEHDHSAHASGFVFEVWRFGDATPQSILTDHPMFEGCLLIELLAAMAVLVTEQSSPQKLGEEIGDESRRLGARIRSWALSAPEQVRKLLVTP